MKKLFLIGLLVVVFCGYSFAQKPAAKITGIYSDMSFNLESGDVNGVEVFIMFTRDGYLVYFQDSDGSPNVPVIVPASIKGSNLTFTLPERRGYSGRFVGVLERDKLKGRLEGGQISKNGSSDFVLKRKLSYWQSR